MTTGKKSKIRQLPSRGGLNDLGKSQRTIMDYGKRSPIAPVEPAAIVNLRKGK